MTPECRAVPDPVETLREDFDRSFRAAPTEPNLGQEDFLAVRIGDDPYAIRAGDIAGLHVDRMIVPIPSPAPTLLGLWGFRGVITPVHDLRLILGYAGGALPRWLVLVRTPVVVGLAFDRLEAHLQASLNSATSPQPHAKSVKHLRGLVQLGGILRPLVDLAAVIASISCRTVQADPSLEQ